jgi:predicted metal-binding membrane protein
MASIRLQGVATLRPTTVGAGFLIAAAWFGTVLIEVTGHAGALHHHALIEGEPGEAAPPPLWLAISIFLVAWQLMIGAMMLPASVRALGVLGGSRLVTRSAVAVAGFLVAYFIVWTVFGLAAFIGDVGLHRVVDATPALAERPWLIQAATLALAGAWQLLPLRRRALEACRHPKARAMPRSGDAGVGFRVGLGHALDCLACSWALMLLMFAAGFANLGWMLILAAVMAYEALGRHGATFGKAVGLGLLGLALVAASGVVLGF